MTGRSPKSQLDRLLEAHPWWEKVIDLSRDLFRDQLTLPELQVRLRALYDARDHDFRDERSRLAAELVGQIAHRLPGMLKRDAAAEEHQGERL